MTKTSATIIATLSALILVLCWKLYILGVENQQLRDAVGAANLARDRAKFQANDALSRVERAEKEARNYKTLAEDGGLPESAEAFENALDLWIGKVRKVSAYLDKHPELRIPQMDYLTAENWLDVTKAGNLDTDADFRRAIGKLRGLGRQKLGTQIGAALTRALAANKGQTPADTKALIPFLPRDFNLAVLDTLEMNPSGTIPTLNNPNAKYILIDKPVDLWDSTMFYDTDGHWGMRHISSGQERIEDAMAKFQQANGFPATNAAQLLPYNRISQKYSETEVEAVLRALQAKPRM